MFKFVCFLTTLILHTSSIPTSEDIDDLRSAIREEIDDSGNNRQLLAPLVRLIFHDCAGPSDSPITASKCNGCIDLSNLDHNGLFQSAIQPLEDVFNEFSAEVDINRADFWAFAATVAIQYAQELDTSNPGDTLPDIPYFFGRETCPESPDSPTTKEFVGALWGWTDITHWFQQQIGFSERETVAIIGAHTLGKAHRQFSGFSSIRWKRRGPDQLNNEYYENLFNFEWNHGTSPNGLAEWRTVDRGREILMLNADMSLVKNIESYVDLGNNGRVSCPANGCGTSTVEGIARLYAQDNQVWLDDFAEAFVRLITTGYEINALTVV